MSVIISLIVYLIILGLLWYVVSLLPLPAPMKPIIQILFVLLLILVLLSMFGLVPGGNLPLVRIG